MSNTKKAQIHNERCIIIDGLRFTESCYDIGTNLAYYRKMKGLSQFQLAKASDVSIRSIQLFEQRKSNINNAQYNHLSAIAKVLGCRVEDLLE